MLAFVANKAPSRALRDIGLDFVVLSTLESRNLEATRLIYTYLPVLQARLCIFWSVYET